MNKGSKSEPAGAERGAEEGRVTVAKVLGSTRLWSGSRRLGSQRWVDTLDRRGGLPLRVQRHSGLPPTQIFVRKRRGGDLCVPEPHTCKTLLSLYPEWKTKIPTLGAGTSVVSPYDDRRPGSDSQTGPYGCVKRVDWALQPYKSWTPLSPHCYCPDFGCRTPDRGPFTGDPQPPQE